MINNFGKKLRKLRIKNSLTVSSLCDLLHAHNFQVKERTIYRWEQGTVTPDLNTLKILSIIYNINLSSFFENQNSKRKTLTQDETKFIKLFREDKKFFTIVLLLTK